MWNLIGNWHFCALYWHFLLFLYVCVRIVGILEKRGTRLPHTQIANSRDALCATSFTQQTPFTRYLPSIHPIWLVLAACVCVIMYVFMWVCVFACVCVFGCVLVCVFVCVSVCMCVWKWGGQEDVQQHLLNSLPRPSPGSIFTQISSPPPRNRAPLPFSAGSTSSELKAS